MRTLGVIPIECASLPEKIPVSHYAGPLLTRPVADALLKARDARATEWNGSMDLGRSQGQAQLHDDAWTWREQRYPYPSKLKDRTIYYWEIGRASCRERV